MPVLTTCVIKMLSKYFNFNNSQPQHYHAHRESSTATLHLLNYRLASILTIYALHYTRSAENYYTTYSACHAYL